MPYVLTTASGVHCATNGTVTPAGKPKLTVAGKAVTTPGGIKGTSVSGCTTPTSNSTKPCTTVASATGAAAKLTVGGIGVALSTLTGTTDGSTPALSVTAGQNKLKAV